MRSHTPRHASMVRESAPATGLSQEKDRCHPKRCPAHLSVCLRPAPTPSTLYPHRLSPRSEKVSGRERNAAALQQSEEDAAERARRRHSLDLRDSFSNWFEDSNKNVSSTHSGLFVDEDPPYYINEPSRSDDDSAYAVLSDYPDDRESNSTNGHSPKRSGVPRMDSSGSKSDDFRSVIDDLTVENKRLRQRLRNYEALHCSHLQQDKLFEVRYHGLQAHKKRELEDTLRVFVGSLEQPPGKSKRTSTRGPLSGAAVPKPSHVDSLSSTSYSRPADSAYVSMFPSGDTNVSRIRDKRQRARATNPDTGEPGFFAYAVPEGPFGADQSGRSDKVKKNLVVRKLEQLFTGKEPTPKACNQVLEQQEHFQPARTIEGNAGRTSGQPVLVEGVREARILPVDAESLADGTSNERVPTKLQSIVHTGWSSARSRDWDVNASSDPTPEQRPTRSLDVDPNRVQVPAENIEYIRHLGFSSSKLDADATGEDGEGWVYLNLLISMAQLHTINVTPDFVRKAVAEVSDRFELSRDGRKIRWKGGTEGTQMGSDVGSSGDQSNEKSPDDIAGRRRKRRRLSKELYDSGSFRPERELTSSPTGMLQHLNERSTGNGHTSKIKGMFLGQVHARNGLDYEPFFRHATRSEEDECSVQTNTSMTSLGTAGDSLSIASAANASVNRKPVSDPSESKYGHGPIIFYQGANFCTDLSGDMSCLSEETTEFCERDQDPLGSTGINVEESFHHMNDAQSSSWKSETFSDRADLGADCSSPGLADLQFPTMHLIGSAPSDRVVSREFEASGIGGVQPCDNFAIDVHVRHVVSTMDQRDFNARSGVQERQHLLFNAAYSGTSENKPSRVGVKGEIVSAIQTNLPPSSLPPPSYYLSLSTSETDDDNETGSDWNVSSASDSHSMQMEVEAIAPGSSIQVYRTAGAERALAKSDLGSEDSKFDADDDAW